MQYTIRDPQPYCWLDTSDLSKVGSWVAYADGFGFSVAGFGRTAKEATKSCRVYAEELRRSVTYRVFRHRLWDRDY